MTTPREINMLDIKRFLGTEENPVDSKEFKEFWSSLTDEEKALYKKQLEEILP